MMARWGHAPGSKEILSGRSKSPRGLGGGGGRAKRDEASSELLNSKHSLAGDGDRNEVSLGHPHQGHPAAGSEDGERVPLASRRAATRLATTPTLRCIHAETTAATRSSAVGRQTRNSLRAALKEQASAAEGEGKGSPGLAPGALSQKSLGIKTKCGQSVGIKTKRRSPRNATKSDGKIKSENGECSEEGLADEPAPFRPSGHSGDVRRQTRNSLNVVREEKEAKNTTRGAADTLNCLGPVFSPSITRSKLDAWRNSCESVGEECPTARGGKKSGQMEDPNDSKLFAYAQAVVKPRLKADESDGRRKGKEKVVDVEVGSECLLVRGKGTGTDAYIKVLNTDVILESVESNAGPDTNICKRCGREQAAIAVDEQRGFPRSSGQDASSASHETSQQCCENRIAEDTQRPKGKNGRNSGRAANAKGKRMLKTGVANSKMLNILELLIRVEHTSNVSVKGTVVKVDRNSAGDMRCMVLLDCYLPRKHLVERMLSLKNASVVSSVFIHLRCDWEYRAKLFKEIDAGQRGPSCHSGDSGLWDVGECLVYDCKLHNSLSEGEKSSHFDLHSLFKSLPAYDKTEYPVTTRIRPECPPKVPQSGLWDVPDEVVSLILEKLLPSDLQKVAAVCRHIRYLANTVMPCMNLKLYPHQEAAVRWMLHREQNPQTVAHPHIRKMCTPEGLVYHLDCVTGEFLFEGPRPLVDFRGGLFCDEPGLGKTVTALSLILKTQGVISRPPPNVFVKQLIGPTNRKYGYYEIGSFETPEGAATAKRSSTLKTRRYQIESPDVSNVYSAAPARKRSRGLGSDADSPEHADKAGSASACRTALRTSVRVKRKLWERFEDIEDDGSSPKALKGVCVSDHGRGVGEDTVDRNAGGNVSGSSAKGKSKGKQVAESVGRKDKGKQAAGAAVRKGQRKQAENDNWVQCDACGKWRKLLPEDPKPEYGVAWFCNMNKDPSYQDCSVPEMFYDRNERIMRMPGFAGSGHEDEEEQNIVFFRNVLKEKRELFDAETKRAVFWLAGLSVDKLARAAVGGLSMPPGLRLTSVSGQDEHRYDEVFEAFGLVKRKELRKGVRWVYPRGVVDLTFDAKALKVALSRPVDDCTRFYLSKATLIVVPQNLIEHWKTQIKKHTKHGQLRVFVWNDVKKPPAPHALAWEYDIVITTFSRLSLEWTGRSSSPLLLIHWLRIMLDEGHTLGSSVTWTNKFQMAICMQASRRWLLTGTPTPNTPSSQVSHLQPMLKFLHEPFYGYHHKLWDGGILRPFEGRREEGLQRLMRLLKRCMISARKSDLNSIPPCIRKVTLLNFTEQHAVSYNELVVTVKRNILMADWNDPSHVESLLNPKLWKLRSHTLRNVRLSCCVAGHIKVWNAGEDIQETMEMFVQQGMDPKSERFITIKAALIHGGDCQRCQEWCRLPIITPCRHLLCLSCVTLDHEKCALPGCANPYQMQSPQDRARPENPNPKWPVPQDLIELQPSYVQDNWDPDWHATASSKVAYLVGQLKAIQERNEQLLLKEPTTRKSRPEKVIVFSQFLEHIHVVEAQLTAAGLRFVGMYSPMQLSNKMKSLVRFQTDPDITVIVMDGSAALGLDLSFVTHVYLMEPIWDRSVEEQVVSRAHRMGATRPVLVETLAMRGTIEEQMIEYLKSPMVFTGCEKDIQDTYERGKLAQRSMHDPAESNYLAHLEFVRTHGINGAA